MASVSDGHRRILAVGIRMLTPDMDTGSHRMLEILRAMLAMSYEVVFCAAFPLSWPPYDARLSEDIARLKGIGIRVPSPRLYSSVPDYLEKCQETYEIVILSDVFTATRYLEKVRGRFPKARVVFDTVDLHYRRQFREAKIHRSKPALIRAMNARTEELEAVKAADLTLVVSETEKTILRKESPGSRIYVLAGAYETMTEPAPFEDRRDILFVGSFEHAPNIDAVEYFVGEVFPLILDLIPDMRLHVAGAHPPQNIRRLASEKVIITGYVPNLEMLFQKCRISVAPLRFGAGIKGKILTSLSFGVPVVTTPIGSEGMDLQAGSDILVAGCSEDFACQLVQLYNDKKLWDRLSHRGLDTIKRRFSPAAVRAGVEQWLKPVERSGGID